MTVIAYKNGMLVSDSKAVDDTDGLIFRSQKLFRLPNKSILGCAGDADSRDVITLLGKASITKMPSKTKLNQTETNFQGIWVFETGELFLIKIEFEDNKWTSEILPVLEGVAVAGHGGSFAMGAMQAGKSATEAVKITCKLDNTCGLPIQSLRLKEEN